ncbi:MAG: phospho-sugar mutase [Oscillospiraceae bacterium]|jgi:phosphoglucomutase|nr:phospho-sugar mutase [Oscillospiraceae bacterium]
MHDVNELYDLWKIKCINDSALMEELKSIEGNDAEIVERFYKNLEFGTAGLRGILGAGTNRMNVHTVNQSTQGLCSFLNDKYKGDISVAIAFDSRNNSYIFAKSAAGVFAANGIKVHFFQELVPTPMLSFAVRNLGCKSGIIITASHNPAEYNGYKCYSPQGYQMTDDEAKETYEYIQKTDMFDDIKKMDFDEALETGMIELVGDGLIEDYYKRVHSCAISAKDCITAGLKVIFTPLNGAGNKPVREILKRIGIKDVRVVKEQQDPNGNFPTCPYPNPEIRQAFERAIKLAKTGNADLLIATDPDCDRMGTAVFDGSEYKLLSGNEVGALFTQYILSQYKEKGIMPDNPIVLKSIVTSTLIEKIAKRYGARTISLLTGFKYIGEYITELEKEGIENSFIIGIEESYGYLIGTHARDKDAVVASMLVCEMASYYKNLGKTLIDVMNDIYNEYGAYLNKVENFTFQGAAGMKEMSGIMSGLRCSSPDTIAGLPVLSVTDYETGDRVYTNGRAPVKTGLPSSNVISYELPNGSQAMIRPSGTEPKIKIYITACESEMEKAQILYNEISDDLKKLMKVN